jgi:hypothetical protein
LSSDIPWYYNYTDDSSYHIAVFTLTADSNGDGGLAWPLRRFSDI